MDSAKMTTVYKVVLVSQSLACYAKGGTVGEITKKSVLLSKGQVQRILDELVVEGYASVVEMPHGRTGKKVYRPTEGYMAELAYVTRTYMEVLEHAY